jgi:NAD(P)-dependent dehydrogenase (short-subunit alcohol dehydrogenase family)
MAVKTWFITGTSAGFGRRLTERLLERGDQVAATLRRPEALAGLAARYPGTLWTAELDVTDTSEVRAVTDRAFAELGRVDVIISNAGYALRGAGEEPDDKQVEQQFATNVLGPMALARAAIPHFRTQGDGHLIQLSSIGGLAAFPFVGYYNATKWAMEGFYEALHQELAPLRIHATLVEPGGAPTDNQRSSQDPPSQIAAYANARAVQLAAHRSATSPRSPTRSLPQAMLGTRRVALSWAATPSSPAGPHSLRACPKSRSRNSRRGPRTHAEPSV